MSGDQKNKRKPSENDRKSLIEALLFASQKGMKIKEISEKVGLSERSCKKILNELKDERKDQPIQVRFEGNRWKMLVRDDLTPSIHNILALPAEVNKSIVKTLAVVAYKAPVKQSDIIYIRGNKAYEHIKNLESEGFIKSKPHGRTKLLTLSQRFYDYFHITKGEEKYLFEKKAKANR